MFFSITGFPAFIRSSVILKSSWETTGEELVGTGLGGTPAGLAASGGAGSFYLA